jgi:hypothetical protein
MQTATPQRGQAATKQVYDKTISQRIETTQRMKSKNIK